MLTLTIPEIRANFTFLNEGWLHIHRAMDRDLQDLAQTTQRLNSMNKTDLKKLERWFGFMWQMIDEHHTHEDNKFFPIIDKRVSLAGLDVLTKDHTELVVLIEQMGENFKSLQNLSADSAFEELSGQQRGLAYTLSHKLSEHLDREESIVLPLVSANFEEKEQRAMMAQDTKDIPIKSLPKLLPWVASTMTPQEQQQGLKALPVPVRILYRLFWQKNYVQFSSIVKA